MGEWEGPKPWLPHQNRQKTVVLDGLGGFWYVWTFFLSDNPANRYQRDHFWQALHVSSGGPGAVSEPQQRLARGGTMHHPCWVSSPKSCCIDIETQGFKLANQRVHKSYKMVWIHCHWSQAATNLCSLVKDKECQLQEAEVKRLEALAVQCEEHLDQLAVLEHPKKREGRGGCCDYLLGTAISISKLSWTIKETTCKIQKSLKMAWSLKIHDGSYWSSMNSISNTSFTAPSYVNAQCLKLGFPFEIHPNMLGAPQTNLNLYPKLDASNFHIKNHKKSKEINSLSYFFWISHQIQFTSYPYIHHHIPLFLVEDPPDTEPQFCLRSGICAALVAGWPSLPLKHGASGLQPMRILRPLGLLLTRFFWSDGRWGRNLGEAFLEPKIRQRYRNGRLANKPSRPQ